MPRRKAQQPIHTWESLGMPPLDDELAGNAWAHRTLTVSMYKTLTDRGLDERERRKELREIANAMRGLIPQARLAHAEDAVRGDAQRESSTRVGPELEDAPQLSATSGRPQAKRGRPRKRSLL